MIGAKSASVNVLTNMMSDPSQEFLNLVGSIRQVALVGNVDQPGGGNYSSLSSPLVPEDFLLPGFNEIGDVVIGSKPIGEQKPVDHVQLQTNLGLAIFIVNTIINNKIITDYHNLSLVIMIQYGCPHYHHCYYQWPPCSFCS